MHSYRKFSVDSLPNIFRTFGDLLHPLSLILFYDNYLINEDD